MNNMHSTGNSIDSEELHFSTDQRSMIRRALAPDASDAEFELLLAIAAKRQLDPILGQIRFASRWDSVKGKNVWTTQVSIDGLRAVAQRTGLYAGQDEPIWIDDSQGRPARCSVSVYRKDWLRPCVGVAFFDEYVQKKKDGSVTKFWATMPRLMIAKVAEALALRKAFPDATSGLYTGDEMGQSENAPPPIAVENPAPAGRTAAFEALLDFVARAPDSEWSEETFGARVRAEISDPAELGLLREAYKARVSA